jgi:hypothetical protein
MKKLIVLIALLANFFAIKAQVRFIVQPLFEGVFSQDRVFQFSVINTQAQGNAQGFISIVLSKLNGEAIVSYQSAIISLKSSEVQNGVVMEWQKSARFASNEEGKRLRDFGVLPFGHFNMCYMFNNNPNTRFCSEVESQPLTPPRLVYPDDKEIITDINPVLSWLPPMPILDIPYNYAMKLVELQTGQTCGQALQQNVPVAQVNNYSESNYSINGSNGRDLEFGKTYCWQVGVYNRNVFIANTEIWQFSPKQPFGVQALSTAAVVDNAPFSYLKHGLDGETISAKPLLKFIFDNVAGMPLLKYSIYSPSQLDKQSITSQQIPINFGPNYLTVDCSSLTGLAANKPYILEVTNDNNSTFYCRFIYAK